MPVLIATGTRGKNTFLWKCSACDEAFSLERIYGEPTPAELKHVDEAFQEHCRLRHPGASVMGLPIGGVQF